MLRGPYPLEGCHVPAQKLHRVVIVAQADVGQAELLMGGDLQGHIAEGRSEGQRMLAGHYGTVVTPDEIEVCRQVAGNPPQPWLIL
jgi:hypothetical protein